MSVENALQYAQAHRADALNELKELLRIPSISAQPDHAADVRRAADWLAEHMRSIGLHGVQVFPTEGHPIVYGEWLDAPGAPTVLVYGHYDVQPVDPVDLWQTPPFEPTERDGVLLARGAADDKGQVFIHLKAVEAYLKTDRKLPVNIKFVVEGEEEVSSVNLAPFVRAHTDRLRADVVLISDTGWIAPGVPSLVYGLRGLTYMEVEVVGPRRDLHSGEFGGAVHNPIQVLCELLAQLKDDQGRILVEGFYDRVRPLSDEERDELARIPFDEAQFRAEAGVPQTWGEQGYTVLEQLGARPTLELNGIVGGYIGLGAKTVIPSRALAKVSMRLVPDQDPLEVADLVKRHVERLAPPTVQVEARLLHSGHPAMIDRHSPAVQAAASAYEAAFGRRPVFIREGGSIPIVADFQQVLGAPSVLMGFGLPDDNLHAPNEKFGLAQFYGGIETSIHFLSLYANTSLQG